MSDETGRMPGSRSAAALRSVRAPALLALTLIALVLRVVGLNNQLWYDEIVTLVETVRPPLATVIGSYATDNQHTLYAVLAKAAVSALGEHAWSLRLPAMLLGVACVPALYLLGRAVATTREALAASALLAVSYHHVWFSQNARGYTGLLLATLVATWCYVSGLRGTSVRPWAGYVLAVALGGWMQLTMAFVGLAHALVLAGLAVQRAARGEPLRPLGRPLAALALAAALTAALYAPALPDLARFFVQQSPFVRSEWTKPGWAAAEAVRGLRLGYGAFGLAAAVALGAFGVWRYLRESPMVLLLLVLPGALGLATLVAVGHNVWPRFFFYAFGFGLLILVRGASAVAESLVRLAAPARRAALGGRAFVALVGLMIAVSIVSLRPAYAYPKQDLRGALEFVEERRSPGDDVLIAGWIRIPYLDYYRAPWTAVADAGHLDRALATGRRLWMVYSFPVDLWARQPDLAERIERHFSPVRTFGGTVAGAEITVRLHDPVQQRTAAVSARQRP